MKISKALILTIAFCMAAIVSIAHAGPTIILVDDKIDASVNISLEGVIGPAKWNESYSGPAYLGTLFQGADIEVYVKMPDDENYCGVSRFYMSAPGKFTGKAPIGPCDFGSGPGQEWAGKNTLKVHWVFKVTGGDTSVYLGADDWSFDGAVGLKLIDLTTGDVLASLSPASFNYEDATVTLMDSHVYRLDAYAWARDFGNGDPDNIFYINFDTSDIIIGKLPLPRK